MNLHRPLRFETSPPLRLAPFAYVVPLDRFRSSATPLDGHLSMFEFGRLLARYKRAGYEWNELWSQTLSNSLLSPLTSKIPMPVIVQAIIDPFESADWIIQEWHIKFLLSERLLTHARKQSTMPNWYEDPIIAATWNGVVQKCFRSVQKYHKSFAIVPMVGDRLFNEDTGLQVQDRSIDGDLMTITFTLDS